MWQPIATVPVDVDVLLTDGDIIFVAQVQRDTYRDGTTFTHLVSNALGGYEWEWYVEVKDLTHWMSLPALPEKEGVKIIALAEGVDHG